MNPTNEYFMEILRAFVQETNMPVRSDVNWKSVFHLAQIHSVFGIVGYMIKKLPSQEVPRNEVSDKLMRGYNSTVISQSGRAVAMEYLEQKYSEADIPCVPMKGYIIRDFYPIPELRTYGDIDFLILPEDRKKSHEIMLANGYICDHKELGGDVYIYKSPGGWERYEIHTRLLSYNPNRNFNYTAYAETAWTHVKLTESGLYRFTAEFHMIYVFLHLAKHCSSYGAGVRMFMDVALIMKNSPPINWCAVIDELQKLRLGEFLTVTSALCECWFGVSPPFEIDISVDPYIYEEICNYIISGGTFGFENTNDIARRLKRANDALGEVSDGRIKRLAIIQDFFPRYTFMLNRYPILKKVPVLMPICWIIRLLDSVIRYDGAGIKRLKQLFRYSKIKTNKSYSMMKAMGLNSKKRKK